MTAYARTPSSLTWLRVNHLINGLHKYISCKTVYMPLIRTLRYVATLCISFYVPVLIVAAICILLL